VSETKLQPGPLQAQAMDSAHGRILYALNEWLARHPAPDQPALGVAQLGEFSPRELCAAVEMRTDAGQFIESLILFGARIHGGNLNAVLESFAREATVEAGIAEAASPSAEVNA